MGADAVKILIYYSPFDDPRSTTSSTPLSNASAPSAKTYDIPFFLRVRGYDPGGRRRKGFEFAKKKPEIVTESMAEFSKPQYKVDVLKVEVPVNAEFRGRQQRI